MNTRVGTNGWARSRRRRLTVAKVRIIGMAEGSIMPGIIAHQMSTFSSRSAAVHGAAAAGAASAMSTIG